MRAVVKGVYKDKYFSFFFFTVGLFLLGGAAWWVRYANSGPLEESIGLLQRAQEQQCFW